MLWVMRLALACLVLLTPSQGNSAASSLRWNLRLNIPFKDIPTVEYLSVHADSIWLGRIDRITAEYPSTDYSDCTIDITTIERLKGEAPDSVIYECINAGLLCPMAVADTIICFRGNGISPAISILSISGLCGVSGSFDHLVDRRNRWLHDVDGLRSSAGRSMVAADSAALAQDIRIRWLAWESASQLGLNWAKPTPFNAGGPDPVLNGDRNPLPPVDAPRPHD